MLFYPEQKTGLFIDGITLNGNLKGLFQNTGERKKVDYLKLLEFFQKETTLMTTRFYTVTETGLEHNPLRKLIDFLTYNGYNVFEKTAKEYDGDEGKVVHKGRVDVEMTADMISLCDRLDHIVAFVARAEFAHVAKVIQSKGVRFTVIGTDKDFASDDLRRQADSFINLGEIPGALEVLPPKDFENHAEKR